MWLTLTSDVVAEVGINCARTIGEEGCSMRTLSVQEVLSANANFAVEMISRGLVKVCWCLCLCVVFLFVNCKSVT